MPKGKFGLRVGSVKERAAALYQSVSSPHDVEHYINSRQMNVLHERHEAGYPVYAFGGGVSQVKSDTKFLMVDVMSPKPFTDCVHVGDGSSGATISHMDAVNLGMPMVHHNLVAYALIPTTLFRAVGRMRLRLTNVSSGQQGTIHARERAANVAHPFGIPEKHWNTYNQASLERLVSAPDTSFLTVGSRQDGIRVVSYD
jgi:hypothetical protein|tara:strand:- start:26242 stop:26838 length:597 start_codon:yes stop_codon:yes gene_type:complete